MNTTLSKHTEARRPLEAVLESGPADRWSAQSPCEHWSARDVVRHLIDTQREFLTASLTDEELDVMDSLAQAYGDVLYTEGVCKPEVECASGDDRQARVLAKLGRRA
ncbi:maleylpyruvate isomerase N-terminal domain-containing protein [Tessaracoccus antarcticus]|uniref:Mycothiol-dependent maleylpyruvate isomerase metal-binding domain-containing protein n=1 Tax=Tessaracoccus antarcticus TaxID=2479848 RepID=A0A3M0G1D9_9ACTN|nr:maleylpyruvate isomerase N-terminal domain-containing protein [Tessaracoccus antarcticus]RMB58781.1 hypothetical protein EAX62_11670 [Tessaracoccus antarcticus]